MKKANHTLQKLRDYITDLTSLMSRAILIWSMILVRVCSDTHVVWTAEGKREGRLSES